MNRSSSRRLNASIYLAIITREAARCAFIVGSVVLMVMLLLPAGELPQVGLWDKLEHGLSFSILAFTGAVAFPGKRALPWLAFALPCLSVLCEVLQLYVPGRSCSPEDALANTIGIAVGFAHFMTSWQDRLPAYGRDLRG